jgi:hypothetical protein
VIPALAVFNVPYLSRVEPGFPCVGMTPQMHDGDDQDQLAPNFVDNAVGKSLGPATPGSWGELLPRVWELGDPSNGLHHFRRQFVPEALAFAIVIRDRLSEFGGGYREQFYLHWGGCRLIRLKTSWEGMECSSPRS